MASRSFTVAAAPEEDGPALPQAAMSPAPTRVATGPAGGAVGLEPGPGAGVPGGPGGALSAGPRIRAGEAGRASMPRTGALRWGPPIQPKKRGSAEAKKAASAAHNP